MNTQELKDLLAPLDRYQDQVAYQGWTNRVTWQMSLMLGNCKPAYDFIVNKHKAGELTVHAIAEAAEFLDSDGFQDWPMTWPAIEGDTRPGWLAVRNWESQMPPAEELSEEAHNLLETYVGILWPQVNYQEILDSYKEALK